MKILRRRETNREIVSGHFLSLYNVLKNFLTKLSFFFFRERIIPKFFYLHEIDRPVSKILWQLDQTF